METAPGKVIRSLRQALDMTQAEFARTAGWSTSTISSWERGTAKPSRLAFKLVEGDQIGGRDVVAIANDEVTLAGGGAQRRVRLGFDTPLE
jgi:DNA-binding transcriptional regulator YiaG